jgi:hypothetical protein
MYHVNSPASADQNRLILFNTSFRRVAGDGLSWNRYRRPQMLSSEHGDKPSTTLPGTVQKIIKSVNPKAPEKAEITVENAEELYREIRVENTLVNERDEEVALKTRSVRGCNH